MPQMQICWREFAADGETADKPDEMRLASLKHRPVRGPGPDPTPALSVGE